MSSAPEILQRLEQDFLVLLRNRVVERAFPDRLGQKLGRAAVEIGLDLADALRLAAEGVRRVQPGVVIELDERLERHPEPAAIVEDGVVMVGDSPRPRIEVEAGIEGAKLGRAAELGIDVAAADRPVPAARTIVVFEDLDP